MNSMHNEYINRATGLTKNIQVNKTTNSLRCNGLDWLWLSEVGNQTFDVDLLHLTVHEVR